MRDRARFLDADAQRIDTFAQLFADLAVTFFAADYGSERAFQASEILADAVVQFAADAAAFLFLGANDFAGEASRGGFDAFLVGDIDHYAG